MENFDLKQKQLQKWKNISVAAFLFLFFRVFFFLCVEKETAVNAYLKNAKDLRQVSK